MIQDLVNAKSYEEFRLSSEVDVILNLKGRLISKPNPDCVGFVDVMETAIPIIEANKDRYTFYAVNLTRSSESYIVDAFDEDFCIPGHATTDCVDRCRRFITETAMSDVILMIVHDSKHGRVDIGLNNAVFFSHSVDNVWEYIADTAFSDIIENKEE